MLIPTSTNFAIWTCCKECPLNGKLSCRTRLHVYSVLSLYWHAVNYHDMCYFRPSILCMQASRWYDARVSLWDRGVFSLSKVHQFKGACIPNAKRESYILNLNATPEIVSCRIWIAVKINRWFSKRIPEFIRLFNILTVFL